MSDIIADLWKLSRLAGVSGYEGEVAHFLAARLVDVVHEMASDPGGGLIGWKVASEGKPLVLLMAPMDEEGLVVKWIEPDGALRFGAVGAVPGLAYQRVTIRGGSEVSGVVVPIDAQGENLAIEIGASSAEEARSMGVRIGDAVIVERPFQRLGGDLLAGRALHARLGPALVLNAVTWLSEQGSALGWAACFPAQTVIRPEAARIAISGLVPHPDVVIGVEAVPATDLGRTPAESCPIGIGHGPGIAVLSPGMMANRRLRELMVDVAEEEGISYQLIAQKVHRYGCTAVQSLRGGLVVGAILIPLRHFGGYEMVSQKDVKDAARLLEALLEKLHLPLRTS